MMQRNEFKEIRERHERICRREFLFWSKVILTASVLSVSIFLICEVALLWAWGDRIVNIPIGMIATIGLIVVSVKKFLGKKWEKVW